MRKLMAVTTLIIGAWAGSSSWAANAVPTPVAGVNANSPLHQLGIKFREDMVLIQKDQKSGKLTQAQAADLRNQLKAIRKEEISDMKANGNKPLTADQASALLAQLSNVEKSL